MNRMPDMGDGTRHSPSLAIVKSRFVAHSGLHAAHRIIVVPADRSSVAARMTRAAIAFSATAM